MTEASSRSRQSTYRSEDPRTLVYSGRILRVLAFSLVALALAACGSEAERESAPPPATTAAGPATTTQAERKPAPDIQGTTLDGKAVSLADYRGKKVIVNLWSSW